MTKQTNRLFRAALVFTALLGNSVITSNSFAAGTDAGSTVSNSFTLDFSVGGVAQTQITPAASTDFTVDRLIDLTVTSQGDTVVAPGQANDGDPLTGPDPELVFSVLNSGNDNQQYAFAIDATTEDFDATSLVIEYYRDTDDSGTFNAGDALVGTLAPNAPSADVAPDELIFVVVSGDIPSASVNDADEDDITLVATTFNPTVSLDPNYTGTAGTLAAADTDGNAITGEAENVFADVAGTSTGDTATDGTHSDTGTFIVASADLTANKTVAVLATDGVDAATCAGAASLAPSDTTFYPVPGACVEYVISVVNASATPSPAGDATNITLADILPDDVTYVSSAQAVFTGGSLATTPATCDDTTVNCTVTLSSATLASGSTGTLTIRALVE